MLYRKFQSWRTGRASFQSGPRLSRTISMASRSRSSPRLAPAPLSAATNGESCAPPPCGFSGHGSDVTHPGPTRPRGFHALISYATCRLWRPPESYILGRFSPEKLAPLSGRGKLRMHPSGWEKQLGSLGTLAILGFTCTPLALNPLFHLPDRCFNLQFHAVIQ